MQRHIVAEIHPNGKIYACGVLRGPGREMPTTSIEVGQVRVCIYWPKGAPARQDIERAHEHVRQYVMRLLGLASQ